MATAASHERDPIRSRKVDLEDTRVNKIGLINRCALQTNIFHTTLLTSSSVPGLTAALYVGALKMDQRSVALAKAASPGNETVVFTAQCRAGSVSRPLRSALHAPLVAAG